MPSGQHAGVTRIGVLEQCAPATRRCCIGAPGAAIASTRALASSELPLRRRRARVLSGAISRLMTATVPGNVDAADAVLFSLTGGGGRAARGGGSARERTSAFGREQRRSASSPHGSSRRSVRTVRGTPNRAQGVVAEPDAGRSTRHLNSPPRRCVRRKPTRRRVLIEPSLSSAHAAVMTLTPGCCRAQAMSTVAASVA